MPDIYLVTATVFLAAVAFVSVIALKAWRDWIGLKRDTLAVSAGAVRTLRDDIGASARIEVADLKERIRKLEAIASGVDL